MSNTPEALYVGAYNYNQIMSMTPTNGSLVTLKEDCYLGPKNSVLLYMNSNWLRVDNPSSIKSTIGDDYIESDDVSDCYFN